MNTVKEFLSEVFGKVRVITKDGEILFCASDIAEILGDRDALNLTRGLDDDYITKNIINTNGGNQNMLFISKEGLHQVLSKSRKLNIDKKKQIYKWLTDEKFIDTITSSCKEEEFINKLIEVLKPLGLKSFKKQFKISKYRIDLYLPELNIAIEYDENNHKGYTYEQQEGRQKEIEENLGCKFIRITDNKTDEHNIGYVINKMFDELIKFRNKKYSTCTLGEILKQEEIKEKLIDDAINTAKDILKSKI